LPRKGGLSRLDGWPIHSPADASPASSRRQTHGSGPMWVATPSLQRTCTVYALLVFTGAHLFPTVVDAVGAGLPAINRGQARSYGGYPLGEEPNRLSCLYPRGLPADAALLTAGFQDKSSPIITTWISPTRE
jgi:hypothetical protein